MLWNQAKWFTAHTVYAALVGVNFWATVYTYMKIKKNFPILMANWLVQIVMMTGLGVWVIVLILK